MTKTACTTACTNDQVKMASFDVQARDHPSSVRPSNCGATNPFQCPNAFLESRLKGEGGTGFASSFKQLNPYQIVPLRISKSEEFPRPGLVAHPRHLPAPQPRGSIPVTNVGFLGNGLGDVGTSQRLRCEP